MRLEDIKSLRNKVGLTQKELAHLSGVSQSAIAKIEAGKMSPTYDAAKNLFDALEAVQTKTSVKVSDIMTKKMHIINSSEMVSSAIAIMKKHGISQLPVFEKGHLVGLVSESVIAENIGLENLAGKKVSAIMNEAPPTLSEDSPVKLVSELLKYNPIVLIYRKAELVGAVTKADLLKTI